MKLNIHVPSPKTLDLDKGLHLRIDDIKGTPIDMPCLDLLIYAQKYPISASWVGNGGRLMKATITIPSVGFDPLTGSKIEVNNYRKAPDISISIYPEDDHFVFDVYVDALDGTCGDDIYITIPFPQPDGDDVTPKQPTAERV